MKLRMLFAGSFLAGLLVLSVVLKVHVPTVHAQSGCTLAALTGDYGFSGIGTNGFGTPRARSSAPSLPASTLGLFHFDGAGNLSTSFVDVESLGPSQFTDTGTYTVNSDCTGSFHLQDLNFHSQMVIVGGGTEVLATVTDFPGLVRTLDFKKQ